MPQAISLPGKSARRPRFACPAPFEKIFWFSEDPNQFYIPHRPTPPEGRIMIVNAGRDAVDADAPITNGAEADGKIVWS
jgi:hypothetical protein